MVSYTAVKYATTAENELPENFEQLF